MTNEELIKNIETQIEFEEKSKSEYNLGRKDAYKNILVLFKQLEVPETTEEPTFLKHLTDLFKKHGYDHLGQVALALEHDLELSINKELPVIPQFVADWIEESKGVDDDFWEAATEMIRDSITFLTKKGREVHDWLFGNSVIVTVMLERQKLITRAWLDGYTIEKESQWVVNTGENEYFVDFFDRLEPHIVYGKLSDGDEIMRFDLKQRAEAVATLIGGTVEEVTQ